MNPALNEPDKPGSLIGHTKKPDAAKGNRSFDAHLCLRRSLLGGESVQDHPELITRTRDLHSIEAQSQRRKRKKDFAYNRIAPPDVVLTNGWNRISYNILRSLGKAGLKTAFGVDQDLGMGFFSKYAYSRFIHRSHAEEEDDFVRDLTSFIKMAQPKVYMPTGEEVFVAAKHLDLFKSLNVHVPVSELSVLMAFHDKFSVLRIADEVGIPYPATILPASLADIRAFGNEYGYPIVLKIRQSSAAKGVHYLSNRSMDEKLKPLLDEGIFNYGSFIVQEFVSGVGYGVSLLLNRGEPRAIFTHRRLREKLYTGGPSTSRISTRNELLEDYATRLLGRRKYHGVGMVEFKFDEKQGKGWLIEVNPRFWGSIGLAINAGVDFPVLLYRMAIDGDVDRVYSYRLNLTYRWLLGDILGVWNEVRARKSLLAVRNMFQRSDGFDDFYLDDPLPFLASIYLAPRRSLRRMMNNERSLF